MFVILKKIENLDGLIINDQRLKRFIIDKNKLKEKDVNQFLIVFFIVFSSTILKRPLCTIITLVKIRRKWKEKKSPDFSHDIM